MGQCQLYKYNKSFYSIKKETSHYFSQDFIENELDDDHMAWLNFHGIENKDEIEMLCKKLDIDRLSVENIYNPSRRPKVEEYVNYMFFGIKSALPTADFEHELEQEQISFILGKNYLISLQDKSSDHFTDVRNRIETARGKIRLKNSDFLLFRMLEAIIDNYFEVIENVSTTIEEIDEQLHKSESKSILNQIEREKRKLIELRKIALPMRDICSQLEASDSGFFEKSNQRYFSHLKSSCFSVLEEIEANKQILEGMANLFYAAQGQKMNEIMKVLTVMSTIFIPLTFIVGIYGMNFENIPELKFRYGYLGVLITLLSVGLGLCAYFYRKGWFRK